MFIWYPKLDCIKFSSRKSRNSWASAYLPIWNSSDNLLMKIMTESGSMCPGVVIYPRELYLILNFPAWFLTKWLASLTWYSITQKLQKCSLRKAVWIKDESRTIWNTSDRFNTPWSDVCKLQPCHASLNSLVSRILLLQPAHVPIYPLPLKVSTNGSEMVDFDLIFFGSIVVCTEF